MFISRENLTLKQMFTAIQADLITAGFETVYPEQGGTVVTGEKGVFVVQSTDEVNAVNEGQQYRIRMELGNKETTVGQVTYNNGYVLVNIASRQHISDSGVVKPYPEVEKGQSSGGSEARYETLSRTIGLLGVTTDPKNVPPATGGANSSQHDILRRDPGQVFIGRGFGDIKGSGTGTTVDAASIAYDEAGDSVRYNYTLSVSNRGVVLYTWENSKEYGQIAKYEPTGQMRTKFSMFAVQSPVDKDTGEVLTDLKSPIFCVFNNDNTGFQKFVVNEADVHTATHPAPAGVDSVDSAAILNEENQVAVKLDNKYLITFPNRVNTERFAYSEELDMIAYTSSRVIGEDTVLELKVYGESEPRRYRAMKSNMTNNTGMRLLVLQGGGGVDDSAYIAAGGNAGDGGEVGEQEG